MEPALLRTTLLTVNVTIYTQDQADMARKYADEPTARTARERLAARVSPPTADAP